MTTMSQQRIICFFYSLLLSLKKIQFYNLRSISNPPKEEDEVRDIMLVQEKGLERQ